MYQSYSTHPPIHVVKNQLSKYARRIAIVQTVLAGSLVLLVALLYPLKDELLPILTMSTSDMQIALTNLFEAHTTIFSILFLALITLLISGIMYLIAFFRLARSFLILGRIIPSVARPSLKTGSFIRYALLIQIAGLFIGTFIGVGLSYISEIANVASFGFLVAAYYNLSLTFKALREQNLYPKKESRLLLYSQVIPVAAMIPLTISISELSSGSEINIIPLIIGGIIIVLGYVGLMIGFYQLSNDVLLIEGPKDFEYGHETRTVYVTPRAQSEHSSGFKKIDPIRTIPPEEQTKADLKKDDMIALYCPNCGTKLKENMAFCHKCGAKVDDY